MMNCTTRSSWRLFRGLTAKIVGAASLSTAMVVSIIPLALAQPAPQPGHESCVDVQVGTAESYSCLNQKLGAEAVQAHAANTGEAPYDARSPSQVTGQFNESATRNRLGANFGHSVTPQRPAGISPGH